MNIFEQLRQHWIDAHVPVAEPADSTEIEAFEARHQIVLPPDFKDYLRITGGMKHGEIDEESMSFASLETLNDPSRWRPVAPRRKRLTFADFLIFSHWFDIELDPDALSGQIFVTFSDDDSNLIAPTFRDFLEAYLANPERVACFGEVDAPVT